MLKQLLNLPESVTDQRLREVCDDFGAKVYAKVRVADVVAIENSGIDDSHYKYALQAHFDFLIADSDNRPLLAIEFDGRSHSTPEVQRRDRLKNELCDRFGVPLLRTNRRYLSRSFSTWDLLCWFATVFFVKRSWDLDVEAGRIPLEDSVFDPAFVSVRTRSGFRSLELERHALAEFGRLFRAQEIPLYVPNWITARGKNQTLRAIAWITVSESGAAFAETAMQPHNLGEWVHFAVRGIVLTQLRQQVGSVLEGDEVPLPIREVEGRAKQFETQHELVMALRCGTR